MCAKIFVLLYLLNTHQIFHNELLLNSWKDSCCRGSPRRPVVIIRRQSVTAASDRWVGLWVLSWLTDTKFHWQSEQNNLLGEQRHRKCWQADHGAAGWRKDRKRQREKQRERVKGDWHVCVISLLLISLWSLTLLLCRWWNFVSILISSNAGLAMFGATGEHWHFWLFPPEESPPLHHTAVSVILHVTSASLPFGSCEAKTAESLTRAVVTVQECRTKSQADRYDTVNGAWNNLCCCSRDFTHEEVKNRNDLEVEFLWDTISQSLPHSSPVYLSNFFFSFLTSNSTLHPK